MHSRNTQILPSVFLVLVVSSSLLFGCAHQRIGPNLESSAVARDLGLAGCKVSVPLDRAEVLDLAGKLGDSNLAESAEWAQAISLLQPGDQLRRVFCPYNTDNFFGVFRGNSVLFKFCGFIYD